MNRCPLKNIRERLKNKTEQGKREAQIYRLNRNTSVPGIHELRQKSQKEQGYFGV